MSDLEMFITNMIVYRERNVFYGLGISSGEVIDLLSYVVLTGRSVINGRWFTSLRDSFLTPDFL